jgi:putative transposase
MKDDRDRHKRQSIRLKGRDYAKPGKYFVTICTENRYHLFGEIQNDKMQIGIAGKMIERWYLEMKNKYKNLQCSHYVIMPNHMHFVLELGIASNDRTPINEMVQWFKTMTTNEYIRMVKQNLVPTFDKRIWQRNYFERIIRSEEEYQKIILYIRNNPKLWEADCFCD